MQCKCQTKTAKSIVDADANYILTVIGNQGKLDSRLIELFVEYWEQNCKDDVLRHHATLEKSHGRDERRDYYTIAVPDEPVFADWKGIKSISMVYRHREARTKEHDENIFFISSLPPKVKRISRLLRDHWKIENCKHYVLNVTFSEEASRICAGNAPEIFTASRRMALNILRRDTTVKDSVRGKRLRFGWDDTALEQLFAGFNGT
ncbi:hypothetical protein V7x_25720 [Crateriforma conspicua]|uniref:Transposase IS4-like domain-containing protein n=1 Tax=Crateriforma conspicua TaxID=2527996 RepID=A0A5C6G0A9_9PLAN|nr:ISAs1 family transposase [Crateriforma conspicua]TWU67000.1 hypothetical protein V7x_25720 [Crateriforma conspicua]